MTVRKFLARTVEEGKQRMRILGCTVDYGNFHFEPDGVILELDEPMVVEKGKSYIVHLPHTVKLDKGMVVCGIPKSTLMLVSNAFIPPTISLGIHDDIAVSFKAKESGEIKDILKLHLLELSV